MTSPVVTETGIHWRGQGWYAPKIVRAASIHGVMMYGLANGSFVATMPAESAAKYAHAMLESAPQTVIVRPKLITNHSTPPDPDPDARAGIDQISTHWSKVENPMQFALRYAPAIRGYLGVFLKNPHDVEDVCQAFLLRVVERGVVAQHHHGRAQQPHRGLLTGGEQVIVSGKDLVHDGTPVQTQSLAPDAPAEPSAPTQASPAPAKG